MAALECTIRFTASASWTPPITGSFRKRFNKPGNRMTQFTSRLVQRLLATRTRAVTLVLTVVALLFTAISCRTVNRVTVMLPNVPGAKYIGSKECEQCHEQIYKDFQTADHSL